MLTFIENLKSLLRAADLDFCAVKHKHVLVGIFPQDLGLWGSEENNDKKIGNFQSLSLIYRLRFNQSGAFYKGPEKKNKYFTDGEQFLFLYEFF